MGEKIKILSKVKILDTDFEIELNHSLGIGQEQQIHIQSEKMRIEMTRSDFIKYGLTVLIAERKLKKIKGIK